VSYRATALGRFLATLQNNIGCSTGTAKDDIAKTLRNGNSLYEFILDRCDKVLSFP